MTVDQLIHRLQSVKDKTLPVFIELSDEENQIAQFHPHTSTNESDVFECKDEESAGPGSGYALIGSASLHPVKA